MCAMTVLQHCLIGWNAVSPATLPTASSVSLSDALTGVNPKHATVSVCLSSLSVCLFACWPFCLFAGLSVSWSVCRPLFACWPLSVCLLACLSVCLLACLSAGLSDGLSVWLLDSLSVGWPAYLAACLVVCWPVCLPVSLFTCMSFSLLVCLSLLLPACLLACVFLLCAFGTSSTTCLSFFAGSDRLFLF